VSIYTHRYHRGVVRAQKLTFSSSKSVYVAGQVLKKLLKTFPDKVDGQQALAEKKANLIYGALEAHPEIYQIVPDKSVRSRMNICFRVNKVNKTYGAKTKKNE